MFPFTPHTTLRLDYCSGGSCFLALAWGTDLSRLIQTGETLIENLGLKPRRSKTALHLANA
jgi:hypothetical protein